MKCRYKEPMECFYLTKDNYKEFLKENFSSLYIDGIIKNKRQGGSY